MRTSSSSSLPLSSATEIISSTEPGNRPLQSARLCAEPAALLHALDGLRHGVHENLVADGLARDVQALHQRHARAEQRAEHPAESRHGELRDQRADQRRLQNQALPDRAGLFPR